MPNLQTLVVSNNDFSGDIPTRFLDSPALSVLDLSFNSFSGELPESIASCQKLVNLNLSHKQLTGEIPKSVARMSMLSVLDLSNNSFVGKIPDSFGSSPALETVNLSYNQLEGPVPDNGMLRTINANDLVGNDGLCGGVLKPCSNVRASSSARKKVHVRHIVFGFLFGVCVILTFGIAAFTGRWLYQRWFLYELQFHHQNFQVGNRF
ncbi:putative non-specific serine/threonine protein kinase [Helianthus annuus]|nr:putative non-specific serine/threonine protein kinase [Helianthus annuus]